MSQPAKRQATYEDLLAVPDHQVAEILDGELVVSPRPAAPHAVASSVLGAVLGGRFFVGQSGPGRWVILVEPELHLGDDVLVPDLAGWRRSRMPEIPRAAAFGLGPDWVCEVLSPSTKAIDRADKLPIYAREGVAHVWLVDPIARTLEVLALDGATFRVAATWRESPAVRAQPFEEMELDLGLLWTV